MTRGTITLCFDDGYERAYTHVLPLLATYRFRAVFAVPVDTQTTARTEGAAVVDLGTWKEACARAGHELAAHGITHRDLRTLNDKELAKEIETSRAATNAVTFVYPGGAHDERIVRAVGRAFRTARTVEQRYEHIPPKDPLRVGAFIARRDNFHVWRWNARACWAILTGQWLLECFHNVSLGPAADDGKRHTVPLAALERHLQFVKRLPIRIATIREIMHTPAA